MNSIDVWIGRNKNQEQYLMFGKRSDIVDLLSAPIIPRKYFLHRLITSIIEWIK